MLPTTCRAALLCVPDALIVAAGLLLMGLSNFGVIPKSNTSILCDDPDIRRVLTTETIKNVPLLVMASIVPFVNIFILEWALPTHATRNVRRAGRLAWNLFRDLFTGQLIALLVVEFFKVTVSEARPHFIHSCRPNLSEPLCSLGYVELTWENCTNPFGLSKPKLLDTMKSFPSGHSALGAFIAVYMAWYLLKRLRVQWSQLLGLTLALTWGGWGAVCGVSRIWDNRHHWWDVLAGFVMGAIFAVLTISWLSAKRFSEERRNSKISAVHPESQPPA